MGQNVTIAATPPAALIVSGDAQNPQSGVIYNQSPNNTLYIGNDPSVTPTDPLNNTPIAPQTYLPFDGTEDVYAIAASGQTIPVAIMLGVSGAPFSGNVSITGPTTVVISGTVAVNVTNTPNVSITGTPSVSISGTPTVDIGNTPNVNVANTPNVNVGTVTGSITVASVTGNVNVLGVGGYIASGQFQSVINDTSTHTLGAGPNNYTTPIQNMTTYSSFALAVQAFNTNMGTVNSPLVARVTLNFYADAAGSFIVSRQTFWMWLASSAVNAAIIPLKISGPLHGGYMSVQIDNWTAVSGISINNIQLYGAGRPISKTTANQTSPVTAGISSSGVTVMPQADWTSYGAPWVTGNPLLTGEDNIESLEVNDATFALNTTWWLPLPLHCGKVSVNYAVASALSHAFVLCSAAGLVSGAIVAGTNSQGLLWSVGASVLSAQVNDLAVGNAPTYAVIASTGTNPSPTLSVTGGMD